LLGGAALVGAVVAFDRSQGTERRPGAAALVAVTAALLLLTQHLPGLVVGAVVVTAAASAVRLRSPNATRAVRYGVTGVGIALVATDGALRLDAGGRVLLAGAGALVVAGSVACATHGREAAVLAPLLVSLGGLYLCLPDTEAPLLMAGVLLPVIVLLAVRPAAGEPTRAIGPRDADVAPAAAALLFVALVASGSVARPDPGWPLPTSAIGGLACAGVLLVWPLARILTGAPRVRPGLPWVMLAVVQAPAVVVIARLGVVRRSAGHALAVSAATLAGLLALLVVGELVVRRRSVIDLRTTGRVRQRR
jgi:hypothetical protein